MVVDLATLETVFLIAMGGWLIVLGGAFLLSSRAVDKASALLMALAGGYAILWQEPALFDMGQALHVAVAQPVFFFLLAGAIFLWTYWLFERHVEQLEESRANLAEALSLERTLVDILGHDLRNPLTSARLDLEWMARNSPDLSDRLASAQSQLDRALDVMANGLAYSRLAPPTAEPEGADVERLNLGDLVRSAVEGAGRQAREKDVNVHVEVAPDVWIQAHPLLERAAQNLVDNAVKFSPKGGRVSVTATREGDEAVVSVADEGPGFEAQGDGMLERFQRGETDRPGHGLGLAIVKRLVDLHKGQLHLRERPDVGAEVEMRIPLPSPEPDPDTEDHASSSEPAALGGARS